MFARTPRSPRTPGSNKSSPRRGPKPCGRMCEISQGLGFGGWGFRGGGVGVWVGGAGFGWFLGTPSDSQPVNLIAVGLDL